MNISVILAHPDKLSFNHAIAQAAADQLIHNRHEVTIHDLYAEKFDPILHAAEIPKGAALPDEINAHCQEISCAEGIIVVHPNWWGQPPAILKGWVDRVLRPEIGYKFMNGDMGEGIPAGLLKAKVAVVFNTSNTVAERERTVFGDPLETLWKNCIFGLCGVGIFYRETFGVIVTSNELQRNQWLDRVQEVVDRYFPKE